MTSYCKNTETQNQSESTNKNAQHTKNNKTTTSNQANDMNGKKITINDPNQKNNGNNASLKKKTNHHPTNKSKHTYSNTGQNVTARIHSENNHFTRNSDDKIIEDVRRMRTIKIIPRKTQCAYQHCG